MISDTGARSKISMSKDSSESLTSNSQPNLQIISDRRSVSPLASPTVGHATSPRSPVLMQNGFLTVPNTEQRTSTKKSSRGGPSPVDFNPPKSDTDLSISPCPSLPTSLSRLSMKGNKTKEIFGSIEAESLKVGNQLGIGEFGSVLDGIWNSPSGDQVTSFIIFYKVSITNNRLFRSKLPLRPCTITMRSPKIISYEKLK